MDDANINAKAAEARAARLAAASQQQARQAADDQRTAREQARRADLARARAARHTAEKTAALAAAHRFAGWAKTNRVKAPTGGLTWSGWMIGVDEDTRTSGSVWMHGDVVEHTSTTRTKCYVTTRGKVRQEAGAKIRWQLVAGRIEELVIKIIAEHPEPLAWP